MILRLIAALLVLSAAGCVSTGPTAGPGRRPFPAGPTPVDDPVSAFYHETPGAVPEWVQRLPWQNVVSIAEFSGSNDVRLEAAQDRLGGLGGVVYFPAGTYYFASDLVLRTGVILRGASPSGTAKDADYAPRTRFVFPRYRPSMEGSGTPIRTAFRRIRVSEPAEVGNCGLVNLSIDHAHVYFAEARGHDTAPNRLVFGCELRNCAAADPGIPDQRFGHQPHQRFTARHRAAIHVFAGENLFVANNRIPKSADNNFVVKPYSLVRVQEGAAWDFRPGNGQDHHLVTIEEGVEFDYDNRPGIYANAFDIGAAGGEQPAGTPETHPFGFRKGTIIRDNFIYCSGRTAILFTGDGTYCGYNVVRYSEPKWRPTTDGRVCSDASVTNGNRAITARGWRWNLTGNDYEVYGSRAYDRKGWLGQGEGLVHESHRNSAVNGGIMFRNKGNRPLAIWGSEVDSLWINLNTVTAEGWAVQVRCGDRGMRNLRVKSNTLTAGGIRVTAGAGENIAIEGNKFTGQGTRRLMVSDPSWVGDGNIKLELQ